MIQKLKIIFIFLTIININLFANPIDYKKTLIKTENHFFQIYTIENLKTKEIKYMSKSHDNFWYMQLLISLFMYISVAISFTRKPFRYIAMILFVVMFFNIYYKYKVLDNMLEKQKIENPLPILNNNK